MYRLLFAEEVPKVKNNKLELKLEGKKLICGTFEQMGVPPARVMLTVGQPTRFMGHANGRSPH